MPLEFSNYDPTHGLRERMTKAIAKMKAENDAIIDPGVVTDKSLTATMQRIRQRWYQNGGNEAPIKDKRVRSKRK